MGGLGRTINGSYAEVTRTPASNVAAIEMASSVCPTFFASYVLGKPGFPLSDMPLQAITADVEAGRYSAKPTRVFRFEGIQEAYRIMEANQAGGKMVVAVRGVRRAPQGRRPVTVPIN